MTGTIPGILNAGIVSSGQGIVYTRKNAQMKKQKSRTDIADTMTRRVFCSGLKKTRGNQMSEGKKIIVIAGIASEHSFQNEGPYCDRYGVFLYFGLYAGVFKDIKCQREQVNDGK
jgi:hypothetical protein